MAYLRKLLINIFAGTLVVGINISPSLAEEISTTWPDTASVCLEFPNTTSPHVRQLCLDHVSVRWRIDGSGNAPILHVSTRWDKVPTLWLRDGAGNPRGTSLWSFSPRVLETFAAIKLTELDLVAHVLPAGAPTPVGLGMIVEHGPLPDTGADYPEDTSVVYAWDRFLIDMPEADVCSYSTTTSGRPVYLPGIVSQSIGAGGLGLANLKICHAGFTGLSELNTALEEACEAWVSEAARASCREKRNGVATAGTITNSSLEVLLAGIEETASVTEPGAAPEQAAVKNLDGLLLGIDDEYEAQHNGLPENQGLNPVLTAAVNSEASNAHQEQCLATATRFDSLVRSFVKFIDGKSCNIMVNDLYEEISWVQSVGPGTAYFPGNSYGTVRLLADDIEKCRAKRLQKQHDIENQLAMLEISDCHFETGDPREQWPGILQSVTSQNNALARHVEQARDLDATFAEAGNRSQAQMSSSFYSSMQQSIDTIRAEFDSAVSESVSTYDLYTRTISKRTVKASTPVTASDNTLQTQPSGQTNEKMVIDQGTSCSESGSVEAMNECMSQHYDSHQSSGSQNNGDTTAKTQ